MDNEKLKKLKKYTINLYDLFGALIEYGQHDRQFKLGDVIKYDPVSVVEIAREFLDKKTEQNPDCAPTYKQEEYAKYLAERMCVNLPSNYTKSAYSEFIDYWKPIVQHEDDEMNEPNAWQLKYY